MLVLSTLASSFQIQPTEPTDPNIRLGWILVHKRWISSAQLQDVLTQQLKCPKKLGELLLENALISEGQLKQALREQHWRRNGYWVIE
jgi:hypothetical protein